jgi:hypothetical protein
MVLVTFNLIMAIIDTADGASGLWAAVASYTKRSGRIRSFSFMG